MPFHYFECRLLFYRIRFGNYGSKVVPYLLLSADNISLINVEPENAKKTATQLWAELKIWGYLCGENTYTQIFFTRT